MRTWLLAILCICLFIRIAAAWVWQSYNVAENYLRFGDSDSYWYLARTIATGDSYQYGSPNSMIFRAPLYPLFLSPFAAMLPPGGSFSWSAIFSARLAGCMAGTACVAIIAFLTARLVSVSISLGGQAESQGKYHKRQTNVQKAKPAADKFAISASVLATLYPGAVGMSIFVLSEALFCPLMIAGLGTTLLAILAIGRSNTSRAILWMFAAGLISGAACLTRPSWSLWPAVLFPYLAMIVWQSKPIVSQTAWAKFRAWAILCFVFSFGVAICMSPWWIRNFWVSGKLVPTTLQVGASLYDGWHEGASGSSDENMAFVDRYAQEQADEDLNQEAAGNRLDGTFEWRLDRRLKNAAIGWAQENSSAAVQLGLVKLVKTWSPMPVARELGSGAVRWAEATGYTTIMLLAGLGMWRLRIQPGAWLFAMPAVYFAILHMFFIGSVRYRQPAVLVLCVLGGVGLVTCVECIKQRIDRSKKKVDGSIASNSNVTVDTSSFRNAK